MEAKNSFKNLFNFYVKERAMSEAQAVKKIAEVIRIPESQVREKINQSKSKPVTLIESDKIKEQNKQTFIDLGMSEAEAEQAARGRDSGDNLQMFRDMGMTEVEAKHAIKGR